MFFRILLVDNDGFLKWDGGLARGLVRLEVGFFFGVFDTKQLGVCWGFAGGSID